MTLQFSETERDLLMRLVDEHARSLLYEIARADSRHFRDELQLELDMTDALRERLQGAAEEDVFDLSEA